MSLFKKRTNKNFRHKQVIEDDTDLPNEDPDVQLVDYPASFPNGSSGYNSLPKKKKKVKKNKPESNSAVLSFGDDLEADDGVVFQEKKSSLSYRLRKEMKRERKEKERDEKMKNQDTNQEPSTLSDFADLGIKIVNGREATAIAAQPGDSDDEDPHRPVFNPRRKQEEPTMRPWDNIIKKGEIPDANLIHEIRKRRQKAREDYIPIDDTVRFEDEKSRLVREDENDHSEDEDARMGFTINHHEADQKHRREVFDAAQGEDSEVDMDWELQQLKKAGAATKVVSSMGISDQQQNVPMDESPQSSFRAKIPQPPANTSYGTTQSMIPLSSAHLPQLTNYEADGILKRFRDSREACNEVYRRHRQEADSVIDELVSCKATTVHCNQNMQPLTAKFQFFQDMRGYVTDLRECLNEKLGEIKKLEEQIGLQARQRKQKLVLRRRQDVKDHNNEFSPMFKQVIQDEPWARRTAEREGRRIRRRREREKKLQASHKDGVSTDDEESYSDIQSRQAEIDSLREDAKKIFLDVNDEFAVMTEVLTYFEDWKYFDSSSYVDTYVSLNLPKIFEPYIRLEMAFWNPLCSDDTMDIEKMKWYSVALGYDRKDPSEEKFTTFRQDSDGKLLSYLVEKVVLAKLKDLVSTSWDPLSHVQSVRLLNLVRHFVSTYPTITHKSKHLKQLLVVIVERIKETVDNDIFIPMFPKSLNESKTSGSSLFFQRQFWSAWKLMGSVLMWHNILSDSQIHDLAIRSLLNLYLVQALNFTARINVNDALDKAKNIISVLPREWCKTEGETHVFLGRLEHFFLELARNMDPSSNAEEIRTICVLLKSIGALNQSKKLADKYL